MVSLAISILQGDQLFCPVTKYVKCSLRNSTFCHGRGRRWKRPFSIMPLYADKYFMVKIHKASHSKWCTLKGVISLSCSWLLCVRVQAMFHCYRMKAGCVTQGCFLSILGSEAYDKRDNSHPISLPGYLFLPPCNPRNRGCPWHSNFLLFFTPLSPDLQLSSLCSIEGKVESRVVAKFIIIFIHISLFLSL